MKQGKDKSSAFAICSASTGYKRRKGGKWRKDTKKESVHVKMPTFDQLIESVLGKQ